MNLIDDKKANYVEFLNEVNLLVDFNVIKETLTRIGIASKNKNELHQTAHILQKRGKYYIVHFKQMFILDGKHSTFGEEDERRLDAITALLVDWNMIENVTPILEEKDALASLKIISFKEKSNWTLIPHYTIGFKAKNYNR